MSTWLDIPGHPEARCHSYRHHVHTTVTRSPRQRDPRAVGRSKHEDFSITKTLDHLTPTLLRICSEGSRLPELTIRVRKPGQPSDDPLEQEPGPPPDIPWFRFELTDVIVTSVLTSIEDGAPVETVTLSYGTVTWHYEGDETSPRTAAWSVHGESPATGEQGVGFL